MDLNAIIRRINILGKLAEDAVRKNHGEMDVIMVDMDDANALMEAADLLDTLARILKYANDGRKE